MKTLAFCAFLLSATLAGCAADTGTAAQSDGSPDSYVPVEVTCSTTCYAGHNFAKLSQCAAAGWAADHTLGCPTLVSKCYCTKSRPAPPSAL